MGQTLCRPTKRVSGALLTCCRWCNRAVSPNISKKRKAAEQPADARKAARAADDAATSPASSAAADGEETAAGEPDQAQSPPLDRAGRERVEDLEDEVLELQARVAHLTEQVLPDHSLFHTTVPLHSAHSGLRSACEDDSAVAGSTLMSRY